MKPVASKVSTGWCANETSGDCDARVAAWYAGIPESDIFISVVVSGEIRRGVERLRPRDPRQAEALDRWLQEVERSFAERILPIDARVADVWGRIVTAAPAAQFAHPTTCPANPIVTPAWTQWPSVASRPGSKKTACCTIMIRPIH